MSTDDKDKQSPDTLKPPEFESEPDTSGLSLTDDGPLLDQSGSEQEETPIEEPDTSGLSLLDEDKPAAPPADDFDLDLDEGLPGLSDESEMPAEPDIPEEFLSGIENDQEQELVSIPTGPPAEESAEESAEEEADSKKIIPINVDENIELTGEDVDFDNPDEDEEIRREDTQSFDDLDDIKIEEDIDEDIEADEVIESKNPILRLIGKPETAIRRAYRKSKLRQALADRFEWYRIHLENERMERVIERTYGGAAENKLHPGRFIRQNILASILILACLLIGLRIGITMYFPDLLPADEPTAGQSVHGKAQSRTAEHKPGQAPKKPVAINYINQAKIESLLKHCLIRPETRQIMMQRFAKTGYEFSNKQLTLAYEELKAIITTYEELDISQRINNALDRLDLMASITMPVILQVRKEVGTYHDELRNMRRKATSINEQLTELGRKRQDTHTINQKIKLRTQLDTLEEKLAKSPSNAQLTALKKALDDLGKGLTRQAPIDRIKIEDSDEDIPEWFNTLTEKDSSKMATILKESVLPPLSRHAKALDPEHAEVSSHHVVEMTYKLKELYLAVSQVMYAPENLLDTYEKDLHGVEERLDKLLDVHQESWLSFGPCMRQARNIATP